MKKIFSFILALAASVGTIFAESGTCGENLTWDLADGVLTISGSGPMAWDGSVPWFSYRENITSVIIGNSVTEIGEGAFNYCSNLTSVTIGNSVTSIGAHAFGSCYLLTSVTIPNSVTSIGSGAFSGCSGLTDVEIPNSVTSIGYQTFSGCSGLTSIEIPNSVTSIGEKAFRECPITSVIWNARNCKSYNFGSQVESFVFGDSVEVIPASICSGMSKLNSITIGKNVSTIGNAAFNSCSNITSVTWNAKNCDGYNFGSQVESFVFGDEVETIPSSICSDMSLLTSINIPDSVTTIGTGAFKNCIGLTSINIPNVVTSIGVGAYDGCSGLTGVTIGYRVKNMGYNAFRGCSNITSVIWNARDCDKSGDFGSQVESFTFGDEVYSIPASCCANMEKLTSITIPDKVTNIGNSAFSDCSGITSVTIGNSVTSIGDYAFSGCSGLTSVNLANVIKIGTRAFSGCSGLTHIVIPSSVGSIGGIQEWELAFRGCANLTSITIESNKLFRYYERQISDNTVGSMFGKQVQEFIIDNVDRIGEYDFNGCPNLERVIIGNVGVIGTRAFYNCQNLTSVTCLDETPARLEMSGFAACTNLNAIYVPCGTLDAYKQSWPRYANLIKYRPLEYIITGNVNISDAGNVTIPQTLCDTIISATPNYGYHFTQWSDSVTDNPRTIELTQDTTFTAEFAYDRSGTCGKDLALVWTYDPTKKVLTINKAGSFDENMRYGVEAPNEMQELVIGDSITIIGEQAFAGIEPLSKVTLGKEVKTIKEQAFYNCSNLESIFNYRATPGNAYSTTFDGVDKYACVLFVPSASLDLYKNATVWRDFYSIQPIEGTEAIDDIYSSSLQGGDRGRLILRNGQILILRGDKTYTVTGQEVR